MIELSVQNLAGGGVVERLTDEIQRVIANICDPNTPAKTARKVKMVMTIKPNEQRNMAEVLVNVDSVLAPVETIYTAICIGVNAATGEVGASEVSSNEEIGRVPLPNMEIREGAKVTPFANQG